MADYKQEHELFVSGHNGTSFIEIAGLTSVPCLGCFAREALLILFANSFTQFSKRLLLDFILLLGPSIMCVTLLSDYIIQICLLLALIPLSSMYFVIKGQENVSFNSLSHANLSHQKSFIVWFRSLVNLMTALAILGVDFSVFPRRLAKSETYGFGGMDTGVGFFVMANAIVSPEARGKQIGHSATRQMMQSLNGCLPLLVLGFVRLAAVKSADYHEHVTEYGVHWNFFFTLAALRITSTLVYCLIDSKNSLLVGIILACIDQFMLTRYGLSAYVIHGKDGLNKRHGIIDANREGIFSIPGYMAIYMLGVALGRFLFKMRRNLRDWLNAALVLLCTSGVCTAVMFMLHIYIEPVSRRLANATFVLWIVGDSCKMLTLCLLSDIAVTCTRWGSEQATQCTDNDTLSAGDTKSSKSDQILSRRALHSESECANSIWHTKHNWSKTNNGSNGSKTQSISPDTGVCLLEAVGYNSLLFFLLANLMTGIVNMSMKTMYASSSTAVFVLSVYLFLLCFIIVVLKKMNICTKVW